ncbi:MAG: hypothetical protein ACI8ZB_004097 [Desulforhopalus sp.]|jgi:uncharacterized protein (TIGR02285 family)
MLPAYNCTEAHSFYHLKGYFMHIIKSQLLIFFSLIFLSSIPSIVLAKDSITWMEAVAPPFFIHAGVLKGQGYEDFITEILAENLPQYEHSHMIANISRHYQQWKQGENSCALAMYKTPEREEFAYFSIPSVFTLPTVLIIQMNSFDRFGGSKTLNLQQLLETKEFTIGRSNNRSYGVVVDNVLNKYGNELNIFNFEGAELSSNLFKMLLAGRIDALVGLPEEAMYLGETLGMKDQIMTLNITENQNDHNASLTYVTCSKTEWGKRTIDDINAVLLDKRPTERYRAAYERWLDPSSIENYRQLYKDAFLTITK